MAMNFFFIKKNSYAENFFIKKNFNQAEVFLKKKFIIFFLKNFLPARVYAHWKTFSSEELVLIEKFFIGPDFKKVFLLEKVFWERS